jgi:hypothetical protein
MVWGNTYQVPPFKFKNGFLLTALVPGDKIDNVLLLPRQIQTGVWGI